MRCLKQRCWIKNFQLADRRRILPVAPIAQRAIVVADAGCICIEEEKQRKRSGFLKVLLCARTLCSLG
ncbi:hypothetical protein GGR61_001591 [Xanthomonas arboricola]|nr:hypothetical protein [Xanthomonas sp. 3058]